MKIHSFYTGSPLRNYNHFIVSDNEKCAFVFDPLDLERIVDILSKKNIENYYLLNTHTHHDHIARNDDFLELNNSTKIELIDNEVYKISETEKIQALFTPGHHPNHYCYLLTEDEKQIGLISGDNIFNAGVGNCKSKGADVDQLFESIMKLNELDQNIIIYPSHDYFKTNLEFALTIEPENKEIKKYLTKVESQGAFFTSLDEERKINPFFRLSELSKKDQFKGMTSLEVFIKLRSLRDKW